MEVEQPQLPTHYVGQQCRLVSQKYHMRVCVAVTPEGVYTMDCEAPRRPVEENGDPVVVWMIHAHATADRELEWMGQGPNDRAHPSPYRVHCRCAIDDVWYMLETPWNNDVLVVPVQECCTDQGHVVLDVDGDSGIMFVPHWYLNTARKLQLYDMCLSKTMSHLIRNTLHFMCRCALLPAGIVMYTSQTRPTDKITHHEVSPAVIVYAGHLGKRDWLPTQQSVLSASPWLRLLNLHFGISQVKQWLQERPGTGRSWSLWAVPKHFLDGTGRRDPHTYVQHMRVIHHPLQRLDVSAPKDVKTSAQLNHMEILRTYSDLGSMFVRDDPSSVPSGVQYTHPCTGTQTREINTCFVLARKEGDLGGSGSSSSSNRSSKRVLVGVCDMYIPCWHSVRLWLCDVVQLHAMQMELQVDTASELPPLHVLQKITWGCFLLPYVLVDDPECCQKFSDWDSCLRASMSLS